MYVPIYTHILLNSHTPNSVLLTNYIFDDSLPIYHFIESLSNLLPPLPHPLSRYFTEQTSQLLRGMLDAADSEDRVMTVEMVEGLQLDASRDRLFLTALAGTWGLNVTMQHSSDVFTCCL